MSKNNGFTIVELLVVIVVISILGSITVVAFNGFQERAIRSSVAARVKEYAGAFERYAAINGRYPGADWRCLGGDSGLPAENGYAASYCYKPNTPNGDNPSDPTIEAALATVSPRLPSPIIPEIQYNATYTYRGIIFDSESTTNNVNGINRAVLNYYIKGSSDPCPVGKKIMSSVTYNWSRCDYPLSTNGFGR